MPSREEQIEEIVSWYKAYEYDGHYVAENAKEEFNKVNYYVDTLKNTLSHSGNAKTIQHYSSMIRNDLLTNLSFVRSYARSAKQHVKTQFTLPTHKLSGIVITMERMKKIIVILQEALRLLRKKKSYAKEFDFLRKLLSMISENYAVMESIVNELSTVADADLKEEYDYEDVVDLLDELYRISDYVEEKCSFQINGTYFELPTTFLAEESVTECLFSFRNFTNAILQLLLSSIKIVNGFGTNPNTILNLLEKFRSSNF